MVVFGLAALTLAVPTTTALADQTVKPEKLWKAYPLKEKPRDDSRASVARRGPVYRYVEAVRPGTIPWNPDTTTDTRLFLQIGMLMALMYIAFLSGWFGRTRRVRPTGGATGLALGSTRTLPSSAAAVAGSRRRPVVVGWTCTIAWLQDCDRPHFEAVMALPDGGRRTVVAESRAVHCDSELEAALDELVGTLVAAGWESVELGRHWSERRLIWRWEREPPAWVAPVGRRRPPRSPSPPGGHGAGPVRTRRGGVAVGAETHGPTRDPQPGRRPL
jgi:hypothetical protein